MVKKICNLGWCTRKTGNRGSFFSENVWCNRRNPQHVAPGSHPDEAAFSCTPERRSSHFPSLCVLVQICKIASVLLDDRISVLSLCPRQSLNPPPYPRSPHLRRRVSPFDHRRHASFFCGQFDAHPKYTPPTLQVHSLSLVP